MIGLYWKAAAGVLISLILVLALQGRAKEMSALLILAVCAMLARLVLEFLEPVTAFFYELTAVTALDSGILKSLLQLVGIGLVSEIANLVCVDAGCSALGKGLQLLSSAVILWLSLPVFRSVVNLIQEIMGTV